jgi:hypothetical protein
LFTDKIPELEGKEDYFRTPGKKIIREGMWIIIRCGLIAAIKWGGIVLINLLSWRVKEDYMIS